MAKIVLTIETNDAGELQDVLSQLSGYSTDHSTNWVEPKADEAPRPASYPTETAEEQPKRVRRTKAQMEADAAAPEKVQRVSDDPFGDQIKEAVKEPAATKEAARAAMSAFMALDGQSAKSVQDRLFEATGAKSIGEVDPADYGKVIAAFAQN